MKILNFLIIIFICINPLVKADSKQNLINELQKGGKLIFPLPKIEIFSINNLKYELNSGCTKVIEPINSIISIKSNCLFLRPTVFSYKKEFMDVHHS